MFSILQNTINEKYSVYCTINGKMKKFAECETKEEAESFLQNYLQQVSSKNVLSASY